ncbi:TonB-dependent receptor [candidate division WOR-3 bacterium]|nr:TonB-dependent receptor [candidate division WOR-3 bacterium]
MRKKIAIIILTMISFSSFIVAHTVTGKVTDMDTHQPVIGANIAVFDLDGNLIAGVLAGNDGAFSIENLPAGSYNLRAMRLGYKTQVKNRVTVRPNIPTYVDFELEEELLQMEGITVRPKYFEKPEDAVVSTRSMDFEEIISQPGGVYDVQRAVQALPAVVSGSDQNNEIIVRGGNYGENLFLIDNMEMLNPNHFGWQGTGGGPVSVINTDFIRSIDFMAGAFPARYGDKASSVLDITLREGVRDRIHYKFDLSMAGAGGTLEGPLGKGSFLISAHRSFLSLVASSFGLTAVPHYYNIHFKAVYDLSHTRKFSLLGIYGKDWITIESSEEEDEEIYDDIKKIEAKSDQYTVGASIKSLYSMGYYNITLSRTYSTWNHDIIDTLDMRYLFNDSDEGENTAKIDFNINFARHTKLTMGLFAKNVSFHYETWARPDTLFIYDSSGNIVDTTDYITVIDVDEEADSWKYGGYAQLRHDAGTFLTLNLGLRYDKFDYTGFDCLSPRVSLSVHLTGNTDLNAAYGVHFQSPQWFELAFDPENHYLKSKYTEQVILGVEHLFADDIKATLEVYYKRYRDVPIDRASTTSDPNDWDEVFVNEGDGFAKGIEFFLQKKVMKNFWGTLSYSYSVAKAFDPRNEQNEYSWDFDYGNVFTLIAGYRKEYFKDAWYQSFSKSLVYKFISFLPFVPSDASEYTIKYRYLGGKPYTPVTYHPEWRRWVADPDQAYNSDRTKPYQRFDVMFSNRWYFKSWNMVYYLEVENLFNHPNVWEYYYCEDGEVETVYQMGRMIVGGVIFEF